MIEVAKNLDLALTGIAKSSGFSVGTKRDWAQSLFNESIIANLPFVNNKKQFKKLTFEQSMAFFKDF